MFGLLSLFSIISSCTQGIKESCEPTIPAENWANKDLEREDILNGVPMKQIIKNAQNGRYKLPKKK